ncbi:type IV secretory pathway VirJ component [Rhizobium sp. BK313]|uniref:virulence factor family protein n=1 Tax=Rhizobium sp. BK313 TaxID=2587081 RepID=UPI00105FCA12|nr:AcvB/VirJ family lysyl-phosphatidylglycerol hydrolase [Rhizobium sp. BK313]MBB3456281.1 type IV secretory pathway VirJ component [Rhizobium sp. BK313]
MILKYAMITIGLLAIIGGPANARQDVNPGGRPYGDDPPLNLPLHIMDAKPTKDTLAVLYSGDGGWQELDAKVGGSLQKEGIPVIGLDSLRYFWSQRTAGETAKDLGRIIDYYTTRFNVQHVLLVGYSFGADVMPASYKRLSRQQKSRIRQISLLAMSHKVDYVVSLRGWLGLQTEGKGGNPADDLKSISPDIVQCIYGTEDYHDNACPSLQGTNAQVIGMPGGHHFDGDYERLAQHIIAGPRPHPKR